MRQRVAERLLVQGLGRPELRPRIAVGFAIPETEQLSFDFGVGAVDHAVTIHVASGAAVPDLELRGRAELQARGLEPDANLARIDGDGDEHRVTDRELADPGNELGIGGREQQERMNGGIDAALIVDLYRPRLTANRPERDDILIQA